MSDGRPPTPSKRHSALTVASTVIATNLEMPIDVPTFGGKFPSINSKKCTNCDKNVCVCVPAMMNGNYLDIFSIFKAIDKMLKDGAARFQDAHKLGIVKATMPDSTESNSTKSNSTILIKLSQRSGVLVNNHALMHDDLV
ncbi:hypothetical protein FPANT_5468 [Fusarium pseudoanthophilum]|uniref:Uncharacterized protein n=1 Tax=Fusarium pseudoanthophilum TaxID=48495 RepID=A0A8H5P8Z5_9HYPO|nr:hypothetical protein FPANT_5468 [Fusarium pseudoanthophilum]